MKTETPGPWTIRKQPRGWNIGDASGNTSFATVWNRWPNAEADLRLIAAAPDLLEAAQAAKQAMGMHGPCKQHSCDNCVKTWDSLHAAIAKAETGEV